MHDTSIRQQCRVFLRTSIGQQNFALLGTRSVEQFALGPERQQAVAGHFDIERISSGNEQHALAPLRRSCALWQR